MKNERQHSFLIAVAAFIAFIATSAQPMRAGTINIGNGATGNNPLGANAPQDPVLVGNGSDVSISVQGSGSVNTDVLMILLVPNNTTDLFGTTDPLGTITTYPSFPTTSPTGTGSSAFTCTGFGLGIGTTAACTAGTGFWGDFTGPSSAKLGDFLDKNLNSSNNMSNFTGFDAGLGVPSLSSVTQYGVYTFDITTGALTPSSGSKPLVDIMIPGGLPQGSILVALDDNLDSTVWTNDGGVNSPVPEPSSLFLIGAGLLGMVVKRRFFA